MDVEDNQVGVAGSQVGVAGSQVGVAGSQVGVVRGQCRELVSPLRGQCRKLVCPLGTRASCAQPALGDWLGTFPWWCGEGQAAMECSSRWGSSDGPISRGSVGSMRGCRVAIKLFDFAAKVVSCLKPLMSLPPLPVFLCSRCSGVSVSALFDSVNFSWREKFDIRYD
jgi:hypothetical protein